MFYAFKCCIFIRNSKTIKESCSGLYTHFYTGHVQYQTVRSVTGIKRKEISAVPIWLVPKFWIILFSQQKAFYQNMNTTIIGVAGGTGSGKSTLVQKLQESFAGEEVITLSHDYYYKKNDDIPLEERRKLNYDHPQAFDTDMMVEHVKTLKNGVPVERPVYSFVDHNRTSETVKVVPAKVVIVEGILIFDNKPLRDLMDIKVFVDTDADVRLARRILRDVKERGRSMESVITQYLQTVKPMHEEFVEPSKKYAHVIIPEGGFNSVAVALLIENIKKIVRG